METGKEVKQTIKERLGEWFGFIILICIVAYLIIHSSTSLVKLFLIQKNGATTQVSYNKARHGNSVRVISEDLHFKFAVDENFYELDRGDAWWYSTGDIASHEKFEVSYWRTDPSLCLPSKYIVSTWLMNTFLFLFSFFLIFITRLNRPWVKGKSKNK